MRIGTWNLDGRWDERHEQFLLDQDCDTWLLTEVSDEVSLPGFARHSSSVPMLPGKAFAAVLARGRLDPRPDPHPAAALADVDGVAVCSTVLPWRSCGSAEPWGVGGHAEKVQHALDRLIAGLGPGHLVWGGDWNHSLLGDERVGSKTGRSHLHAALRSLDLVVPTGSLPSRRRGLLSIDHVAVPRSWTVLPARHIEAADAQGRYLSDHDAYVVEVLATRG